MQTLTISVNVPDELASHFHTLPDGDRRAFLQKMNAFAVSTLREEESEEGDETYLLSLLREPIPAADVAALQESLAEAERGERLSGPDVMRETFARAKAMAALHKPGLTQGTTAG